MQNVFPNKLDGYSIFYQRAMSRQLDIDVSPLASAQEIADKLQSGIDGFLESPRPSLSKKQTRFVFQNDVTYGSLSDINVPETLSMSGSDYVVDIPNEYDYASQKVENLRPVSAQNAKNNAVSDADYNPKSEQAKEEIEKTVVKEGWLEINDNNYGFIRALKYENSENDAFIPAFRIKKMGLRKGDLLKVHAKVSEDNKVGAAVTIDEINGIPADELLNRPVFEELTPIFPNEKLHLEMPNENNDLAIRAIDLLSPIGKGQRAMIVSPPKAGKTTLLKKIAHSIEVNHPDIKLFVLLIDERPEEVTDMKRSTHGEVIYSTFDELPEHHTRAAEMLLARCKRLVEMGHDVVVLMDSLTRLARAYNLTIQPTGRTLSGGIDPGALYSPKRFFGAARNIENGGSMTIIATALVDTGSKMDDIIYEEFKGTGNMEIHLDRKLSEKRIFPAIDMWRSGTRREDLLLTPAELDAADTIRRMLGDTDAQDSAESIISLMQKTKSNAELIVRMKNEKALLEKVGFKSIKK